MELSRPRCVCYSKYKRKEELDMKRITFLTAMMGLGLLTAACNTVEGAGQDIQKGGHAIERAADDSK